MITELNTAEIEDVSGGFVCGGLCIAGAIAGGIIVGGAATHFAIRYFQK